MKRKSLLTVLVCLICTVLLAGCAKNTDSALKDKVEGVKEKTAEEDRDAAESEEGNESEKTAEENTEKL